MKNHYRVPAALAALLLAALACNLPQATPTAEPNAAFTAAAQTVAAQVTQAALTLAAPTITSVVPSPTNTSAPTLPPPTVPPTATTECDRAQFITDVTVPDGTKFSPSEAFTKTWRLRNIGSCAWSGYSLVFDTGDSMSGPASSAIATTPPGGTVDVSVNLIAPAAPGSYRGYWRVRSASGYLLPVTGGYQGKSFYVDIKVQNPTPTSTNTITVPFAVTSVNFVLGAWSDAGHTNCPRVIANITTNGAGTVTYHWTRSDGASAPTNTLTFASAGTQAVNYDWALGSVWAGSSHWVGIYIDSPNHQDFGHLEFTTACTSP